MAKELAQLYAEEAEQINETYDTLQSLMESVGRKALLIGQILAKVKAGLAHGQFEDWVCRSLKFGPRMAQQYMAFAERAKRLDSPTRAALTAAWNEMCNPSQKEKPLCQEPPTTRQNAPKSHVVKNQTISAVNCAFAPSGDTENAVLVKQVILPDSPNQPENAVLPIESRVIEKPVCPQCGSSELETVQQCQQCGFSMEQSSSTTRRFRPPSAIEVTEYAQSIGFVLDGRVFIDFYASKGWKIGNSPMKDWRAAVRTWQHRDKHPETTQEDAQSGVRRLQREGLL